MANGVRIQLNRSGVRDLLRSDWAMGVCAAIAQSAASRLGDGYEVSRYTGRNRVNASISAESREARRENAESNTILKALR